MLTVPFVTTTRETCNWTSVAVTVLLLKAPDFWAACVVCPAALVRLSRPAKVLVAGRLVTFAAPLGPWEDEHTALMHFGTVWDNGRDGPE